MPVRMQLMERVLAETHRQDEKWGADRHLPLGVDAQQRDHYLRMEHFYKEKLKSARPEADEVTWHDIFMEEVGEAFSEQDYGLIIEELIQVAAVAVQIAEDITKRGLK